MMNSGSKFFGWMLIILACLKIPACVVYEVVLPHRRPGYDSDVARYMLLIISGMLVLGIFLVNRKAPKEKNLARRVREKQLPVSLGKITDAGPFGGGAERASVPTMGELPPLLIKISRKLRDYGMDVAHKVVMPGGPTAVLFASRTYFSWNGLAIISQHAAICDCGNRKITPLDMQATFEAAFRQAKQVNRVPLLRGMQFGYMVIPCLIVGSADQQLIDYVETAPRKHWSLFEFPVVIDRSTGRAHFFRKTAMWGGFLFAEMRDFVETCIEEAIPAAGLGGR